MIRQFKLVATIGLLILSAGAAAQMYTWKDENGRTVVSDKPPTGKAAVKVKKKDNLPESGVSTPATNAPAQAGKPQTGDKKSGNAEQDLAAKAEKEEFCKAARERLAVLESGERVWIRNDKGERNDLNDEQRNVELARTRKAMAERCSG